jgi:Tol biopolymer transport system component
VEGARVDIAATRAGKGAHMFCSARKITRLLRVAALLIFGPIAGCGINGANSLSTASSSGDSVPGGLSPSPDGLHVALGALQSGRRNIGLIGLDGSGPVFLTNGEWEYDPSYSPDGRSITFCGAAAGSPNQIFVMDSTGSGRRRITHAPFEDTSPSFSPDSSWVTFIRAYRHRPYSLGGWTWDDMDVCVINASGGGFRRLTHKKFYSADSPHFSPDGRWIVFMGDPAGAPEGHIYLLEAATGRLRQITSGTPEDGEPSFSPDGKRILFASRRATEAGPPSGSDVWTMDLRGRNLRRLTYLEAYVQSPRYLPNGSGIVFSVIRKDDVHQDVWVAGSDGTNAHRVAGPL